MKTLTNIILLIVFNFSTLQASGILDSIGKLIINNKAIELCNLIDENVDITIVDEDQTYSKSQAQIVLKEFFDKNKVDNFEIIHKGSSGTNSEFAIAQVNTEKTLYRVYILVDKSDINYKLIELRFEED